MNLYESDEDSVFAELGRYRNLAEEKQAKLDKMQEEQASLEEEIEVLLTDNVEK